MADHDAYAPQPYVRLTTPAWAVDATIYQVNTRQFTPEGTFAAAARQLPRLRDLGVDIVWLMPIHPIGELNRKGTLGSPYAVQDYYRVNPEFGTLDDLKALVADAHALGMHVILDWVANHTAWDNVLVESHPEWYERGWRGEFRSMPWRDWSDIIDLDYRHAGLRRYMAEAMRYWVSEADIDGYRCDVAGFVPVDFWNTVRRELDAIKPVFMLAEWESRDLHAEAFDMTYAWSWYDAVKQVAQGHPNLDPLYVYYSWNESAFPEESLRMTFVSNHDKNAWEGTQFEQFGDALEAAIVLSVVGEGVPLIYNGQEAGNEKRLEFFERDPIEWREHGLGELYRTAFSLMKANRALRHGRAGGRMIHVPNSASSDVFSFVRRKGEDQVFAVFNFSPEPLEIHFHEDLHHGDYTEHFSGKAARFGEDSTLAMPAWGYFVFARQAPAAYAAPHERRTTRPGSINVDSTAASSMWGGGQFVETRQRAGAIHVTLWG